MIEIRVECDITGASKKIAISNPSPSLLDEVGEYLPAGWVWGLSKQKMPNPAYAEDLAAMKAAREDQITAMHDQAVAQAQATKQPVPDRATVAAQVAKMFGPVVSDEDELVLGEAVYHHSPKVAAEAHQKLNAPAWSPVED